jgi:MinD-like ATPase involved in chromosome partitioning or flagellar assembly
VECGGEIAGGENSLIKTSIDSQCGVYRAFTFSIWFDQDYGGPIGCYFILNRLRKPKPIRKSKVKEIAFCKRTTELEKWN